MLLTIDIGNTNVTLGLYNGNILGSHWRLATDHARMPDEYGLQFQGLLQNAGHTLKDLKESAWLPLFPHRPQKARPPGIPGRPGSRDRSAGEQRKPGRFLLSP